MPREQDVSRRTLSPKQVAKAFAVSESSLKRWCDQGRIAMTKTAGGHRRLSWGDVVRFARSHSGSLVHPDALGIVPASIELGLRASMDELVEQLTTLLAVGDESGCRQMIVSAMLSGHSIAKLCDQLLAQTLQHLGRRWECGQLEIYEERRACEIVERIIVDCCSYIADTRSAPRRAIGAAPEGDPYVLPTRMVEVVLRDAGWHALSLGNNLPLASLSVAAQREQPDLVWVSVSTYDATEESTLVRAMRELRVSLPATTHLLVGGRAIHGALRDQLTFARVEPNLEQLSQFARELLVTKWTSDACL